MKMLKGILGAATALLLVAGPALAQFVGGPSPAPGSNSPNPTGINGSVYATPTGWTLVDVSPKVLTTVEEGYSFDGTYDYIVGISSIDKYTVSGQTWTKVLTNATSLAGIAAVTHSGGPDNYNGKLYTPVETYVSCASTTNQKIAVYNSSDLTLASTTDISAQGQDASGLAIAPDIGANGTIFVSSFCNGTISKYDLSTYAFLGTLTTSPLLSSIQGLAYQSGVLYAASFTPSVSIPTISTVDTTTGATVAAFALPNIQEIEGPHWKNGLLGLYVHDTGPNGDDARVYYWAPPGSPTNLPALNFDPLAHLTIGAIGASIFGPFINSLSVGLGMRDFAPPLNGLAVQGSVGIGTNTPKTQLSIVSHVLNQGQAAIGVQTLAGSGTNGNGNGFMSVTDSAYGFGGNYLALGKLVAGAVTSAGIQWSIDLASGHTSFWGTKPATPTSCGTGPTFVNGSNDNLGSINVGTGTPTACTVAFVTTWRANSAFSTTGIPICHAWTNNPAITAAVTASSLTSITIGFSAGFSGLAGYECH